MPAARYASRKRAHRKAELLRLLRQPEAPSLSDLARTIGVSGATLRRDLRELGEAGLIRRSFGKAELATPSGEEMPFALRASLNDSEKQRIAEAALALLQNGETVFIAGGTTTLALARLLPGRRRLTVITNALRVANELVDKPGIELVLLGGAVRPDEQTLHGHLTEWGAQQLRADKLLYGVQAVSLQHGLTHSQIVEVGTDRALARASTQVIVLADHTKFGKVAAALVLPLADIHIIITGREAPAELVKGLRAAGLQVVLA